MRIVHTDEIIKVIKAMCIEANYYLSDDMKEAIAAAKDEEVSPIGRPILNQLIENIKIAKEDQIPICQDTGMAIVFIEIGQNVHIEGMDLSGAINQGVLEGYEEGYLRKSIVLDPFIRTNTNTNTPAVVHYEIVPGDKIKITFTPKGFGSENMSRVYMLKPSDGIEGVKEAVIETVKLAGPNACPPIVVGVGIGGSFEYSAYLAKKALTRDINDESELEHINKLEKELLEDINKLGIGPGGLGGRMTALGVKILTYPTHIAGLPVAINICCHVNRHVTKVI